ncbi:MAG: aminotransferase class V-fold PLP-dependent enzyme [Candidatus Latescibacterota bacterium]
MAIIPLIPPQDFVGLEEIVHLCTGGEAPWLKAQEAVYTEFARLKSGGYPGRQQIYEKGEYCREKMGKLWSVPSERIAFMPSAAEGMAWLARGLDWRAGDNVVTTNLEFPSVAYAWRDLSACGVEVRLVEHRDWLVEEDDLLAAVDGRTRVLAVSQVSFYSGQNMRLEKLAQGLIGKETLLAVDTTHAAGAVSVRADLCDWCISSAYKWLLATHGTAPCYVSERAENQLQASSYGWRNLAVWPPQGAVRLPEVEEQKMPERLEPGNPSMVSLLFLNRALDELLALGMETIEAHVLDLAEEISAGLTALGLHVISPSERSRRSGNTCFLAADAPRVTRELEAQGVLAWGEHGRVRVSGHLYNGSSDAARLLTALETIEI